MNSEPINNFYKKFIEKYFIKLMGNISPNRLLYKSEEESIDELLRDVKEELSDEISKLYHSDEIAERILGKILNFFV